MAKKTEYIPMRVDPEFKQRLLVFAEQRGYKKIVKLIRDIVECCMEKPELFNHFRNIKDSNKKIKKILDKTLKSDTIKPEVKKEIQNEQETRR